MLWLDGLFNNTFRIRALPGHVADLVSSRHTHAVFTIFVHCTVLSFEKPYNNNETGADRIRFKFELHYNKTRAPD